MMRRLVISILLVLPMMAIHGTSHAQTATAETPHGMLQNVARAIDGLVTVSGRMKRTERINGAIESGDLRFKVNVKPLKVYLYNLVPHEGTELLYVPGWNDGKAYIHPNQFPWISLSLDTYGGQMLDDQHHHVSSTGFGTVRRILRGFLSKPVEDAQKRLTYVGQDKWLGKPVDVFKIVNADYQIKKYTVQPGEDLLKIDAKLSVPSYKLLELNPECDDFFDVTAGQVIKVPSDYGKEIVLMVDPVSHLPIVHIIMDDKGLFEKYEITELKVNPRFSTMEFSDDNEAYNF
jgi:LysM repeat protein